MELKVEKRYLHLPVRTGAPKARLSLWAGGQVAREFEVELDPAAPDFWAFLDLAVFQGQRVELRGAPEEMLRGVELDDQLKGGKSLYAEPLRPQFHFSSRRGWNNDPNGLVYFQGEYHLFYQHNPYGWNWGNMHWGHAVSPDLVHWRELPIALYPRAFGDWAFSGSAVIDWQHSAGFQQGEEPALVAAYTSTGRGECIAYSLDRGRTFSEYEGNPVVAHQGRDPRLLWYGPGRHWVMAVYDEVGDKRYIAFYTSPDLKAWTFQSRIEGYYECPELFALPVDGDPQRLKWVLYAADGEYALGQFDGRSFTAESGKHPFNRGNCFYASQTFSEVPGADGRRIQMAWGRVEMPGMPFNQMMSFPVELSLRTTEEGVRLCAEPVRELSGLRGPARLWRDLELGPGDNPLAGSEGELWEIEVEFDPAGAAEVGLMIWGTEVVYEARDGVLRCGAQAAPLAPMGGVVRLHLLVDRVSIEIFASGGRVYMPVGMRPGEHRDLGLFSRGGTAQVRLLRRCALRSIWGQS
jgi:fructan beta-fructosidase